MRLYMKRFFKFTISSIMSLWIYSLYTMVDGFFVANFVGETEFSAVNLSMPVVTCLFALGILFSIGTQAIVGYELGKKEYDKANSVFSTGFVSLIIVGIITSLLVRCFLKKIAPILGANNFTHDFVIQYLGIILWFGVFFMITYQLEVLVKVDGCPQLAVFSVVSAAISNIFLDYLFIVPLKMGIFGAGLATGISQVISTLLMLRHFLLKKGRLKFSKKLNFKKLIQIIPLGFGDFISELSMGYTVFLFNNVLINTFGQEGIIVYTVLSYISTFGQSTMSGVAQGLAPLFSYDYGRGSFNEIKKSLKNGFIFIFFIGLSLIIICQIFSTNLASIFLKDDLRLLKMSAFALKKYSLVFLFLGYNILMVTLFASLSMGRISTLISLLRTPIFISLIMFLYIKFDRSSNIWYVPLISELLTSIIGFILLYKYFLLTIKNEG